MILLLRSVVGDALLNVAGVLAHTGRAVLGRPATKLLAGAAKGQRELHLTHRIPRITKGLRLEGFYGDEIVFVERTDGQRVHVKQQLAQDYIAGSSVRVLV